MSEAEKDLVAKMLRAVLQSSKDGVAFTRLQDEYKQLTGEVIPHKQLGFPTLENYLKSIPSVVKCRVNKNGELICFATVNNDIAHIAKLVARQRSPKKKHGGQTLVNSQLRLKRALPAMQVGKPKETLRQPDYSNQPGKVTWKTNSLTRGKGNVQGTMTGLGREVPSDFKVHATLFGVPKDTSIRKPLSAAVNRSEKKPAMTFPPRFQKEQQVYLARKSSSDQNAVWSNTVDTQKYDSSALQSNYNSELVQSRLKEILCKYTNGIWFSKLPQLYRKMFNEDLQQEVLKQLEHWTHVCTVEKSGSLTELLLYPPKSGQQQRKVVFNQKATDKKQEPSITNKTVAHGRKPVSAKSQVAKDTEVKQKVTQLLQNYSSGLWANALPKLFEETYKMQFPQNILDDLDCLSDICSVDYAVSGDRKKAILYAKTVNTDEQNDKTKETLSPVVTPTALVKPEPKEVINEERTVAGVHSNKACLNTDQLTLTDNEVTQITNEFSSSCLMQPIPPPLRIPAEQFPSVLVVELHNTVEAVIRYIGPEYSGALEQMEDSMKEHYTYTVDLMPLSSLNIGQLVAVGAEEDSWLRAQIVTVEAEKVKVFFVDHGFNEMVDKAKLYKLDQRFCSLSFQASKCKLAGLEAFCKEPCVLESFELLASGKILLMEILERSEIPLVLLYDTSGDDDFNINAACLKALYDKTLEVNLKENGVYLNVVVTNVCSDGTIYCQVPSKGWNQRSALLEKVEQYFNYRCLGPCHDKGSSSLLEHYQQLTSEYFVSLPFCGKRCLARWRGKWARVEITNVHGARVVDIIFLDIGVVASVAVSELREIPPPFLKDSISIPPQAIKCCLADLTFNIGMWTPDAVMWLRDTVLNCSDCSIKIVKVDNAKGLVHIYLFTSKNFPNPERSINHKITNGDLWKHRKDVYLGVERSSSGFPSNKGDANIASEFETKGPVKELGIAPIKMVAPHITSNTFPPPFALPQPGEHMDVFISVACHPGHFVFQPWQELYKLEVLMEEMVLYYNSIEWQTVPLEKNKIFVAQLDNKWYRVLLKGILTNGLVSVYQLDYGRHELVSCRKVQALVSQFRQLPFQAITAQLAGVKCEQWSEEASIVFRNHVERKPLVAQIQTVQGNVNSWDRKVVTYLVDTSLPDTDVWIHDLLTEYLAELSNVA